MFIGLYVCISLTLRDLNQARGICNVTNIQSLLEYYYTAMSLSGSLSLCYCSNVLFPFHTYFSCHMVTIYLYLLYRIHVYAFSRCLCFRENYICAVCTLNCALYVIHFCFRQDESTGSLLSIGMFSLALTKLSYRGQCVFTIWQMWPRGDNSSLVPAKCRTRQPVTWSRRKPCFGMHPRLCCNFFKIYLKLKGFMLWSQIDLHVCEDASQTPWLWRKLRAPWREFWTKICKIWSGVSETIKNPR